MWSPSPLPVRRHALPSRQETVRASPAPCLVFAITLLLDIHSTRRPSFTGVLALVAVAAFGVQHAKLKRK